MLERLIEFILNGPEDRFADISLEDAALARTWCDIRKRTGGRSPSWEAVAEQLEAWLSKHRRVQWDTEGYRYQWVLRDLIETVQHGDLNAVARDELDFLSWAFDLAGRTEESEAYGRVRSLLAPFMNEIEVLRRQLPNVYRLKSFIRRIHYVDTSDIENAPHSSVRLVAGIALPAKGPLLKYSGHVKLFGVVPDGCSLVVENGCCSVLGYIMGLLAVTHHCDVRYNISGVVISSLGSIRARNVIDQAYVVAKAGNVHVRRVENPKLLFAGERLAVADTIRRGHIIAPDIEVGEEVLGGRIQVSRSLSSGRLRATPELPLAIIFRKRLTSDDYGGVRTREATRLWSEVLRLKTSILTLESLIASTDGEVERLAENALLYICSNQTTSKFTDAICRNKSRLDVIDRIIEGLLGMAYGIAERAAERATALGGETGAGAGESGVMFGVADAVLSRVGADAAGERDVHPFISRIADIREGLRGGVPGSRLASTSLTRIREELHRWLEERSQLLERIKNDTAELRSQVDLGEFIQSSTDRHSPERVLRQLVASVQKQPSGSPVAGRVASNFVSTMMRNMDKKRQSAEACRRELLDKRLEFEKKAGELRTRHHVVVVLEDTDRGEGPRVSGRFEGGVVIYADAVAAGQEAPPGNTRLVVPDTGDVVKTYVRRFTSIVEAGP